MSLPFYARAFFFQACGRSLVPPALTFEARVPLYYPPYIMANHLFQMGVNFWRINSTTLALNSGAKALNSAVKSINSAAKSINSGAKSINGGGTRMNEPAT